jgi:hypothetical protein
LSSKTATPAPHNTRAQTRAWFACARALVERDRLLWLGMAALYLLLGLALKRIPFVGNLLLVLVSPMLLAGALLSARDAQAATGGDTPGGWRPLRALTRALGDEAKLVPLLLVCIVTLGLVLITAIVEYLLTGGSVLSGLAAAGLAGPLRPSMLVAAALVSALYVVLGMALFFLVPLTVLGNRAVFPAMAESLRVCVRHALPLAAFAMGFVALALVLSAVFLVPGGAWLGYPLVFTLGLVGLALFVAGLYCSYCTLFERAP